MNFSRYVVVLLSAALASMVFPSKVAAELADELCHIGI